MIVAALIGAVIGVKHERHIEQLGLLAKRGSLAEFHSELEKFKAVSTAHAHSFLFCVVLILVAFVLRQLPYPEPITKIIPGVLVASTVMWTAAALKQVRPIMAAADVLFFAALLAVAAGLVRTAWLGGFSWPW